MTTAFAILGPLFVLAGICGLLLAVAIYFQEGPRA